MKSTIRVISLFLLFSVLFSFSAIYVSAIEYSDVSESHWAYDAINHVTDNGLLLSSNDNFNPNVTVTRAEAVKTLYKFIHASPVSGVTLPFTDVPSSYTTYVKWAYDRGITSGTSTTLFSPNKIINKQEICTMIVSMYESYGVFFEYGRGYFEFVDNDKIDTWAAYSVRKLFCHFIVNGDAQQKFNPKSSLTRAQFAVLMHQLYEYIYFLAIPQISQGNFGWCWAASATMVGSFMVQNPPSLAQVVQHVKGIDMDEGGTATDMIQAARYASNGTKWYVNVNSTLSYEQATLNYILDKKFPIITYNNNHAMVLCGYSYTPYSDKVIYCNPQNPQFNKCEYSKYVSGEATNYSWGKTIHENF